MAQVNIAHIASLEILSHSANKIFISITKTCPCNIQRIFSSFKILSEKNDIRKTGIPLHTPVLLYIIKVGFKGVFIAWKCFPDGIFRIQHFRVKLPIA